MALAAPGSLLKDPRPEDPCTCNLCQCRLHVPLNSKRACKWCAAGVHDSRPNPNAPNRQVPGPSGNRRERISRRLGDTQAEAAARTGRLRADEEDKKRETTPDERTNRGEPKVAPPSEPKPTPAAKPGGIKP